MRDNLDDYHGDPNWFKTPPSTIEVANLLSAVRAEANDVGFKVLRRLMYDWKRQAEEAKRLRALFDPLTDEHIKQMAPGFVAKTIKFLADEADLHKSIIKAEEIITERDERAKQVEIHQQRDDEIIVAIGAFGLLPSDIVTAVTQIKTERDEARADHGNLKVMYDDSEAEVERLWEYATHKPLCAKGDGSGLVPCDCGWAALDARESVTLTHLEGSTEESRDYARKARDAKEPK